MNGVRVTTVEHKLGNNAVRIGPKPQGPDKSYNCVAKGPSPSQQLQMPPLTFFSKSNPLLFKYTQLRDNCTDMQECIHTTEL